MVNQTVDRECSYTVVGTAGSAENRVHEWRRDGARHPERDPPCHVPKFRRPSVMGTQMDVPTSDVFVCDTLRNVNRGPMTSSESHGGYQ